MTFRITHVVGTLRVNRKGNPKDVTTKKLKKGQIIAQQSNTNVVVLKWKDKRDLLMLSTKHVDTTTAITKRNQTINKPDMVIEYNQGKSFIDRSDQMTSYSTPLRRSLKWYRKVAFDILLGTSLTNALSLFCKVNNTKIKITDFKEQIILNLIKKDESLAPQVSDNHILQKINSPHRKCVSCYKKLELEFGRKKAQNKCVKVTTICIYCKVPTCMPCFFDTHSVSLKNKNHINKIFIIKYTFNVCK
uniref:PiggyBac transposable element-derived protein 4 n=1 Tax=Sipha flava TaxID=143950 RepID=A0A2S2Q7N7_9HEMI